MRQEPSTLREGTTPIGVLVTESLSLIASVGPEAAKGTLLRQLLKTRPKGADITLVASFLNEVFRDALSHLKEQIPGATCDFCLKRREEAFFMVQGPAFTICDECVSICAGAIRKQKCQRLLSVVPVLGKFLQPKPEPGFVPAATEPVAPTAAQAIIVAFAFDAPKAREVSVCGEFNDWTPEALPLKRQEDGRWETTLALPPGRYHYKFVVDGEWVHDPNARENVPNEHGSLDSIIEVEG